jgi:hypothetical protein
VVDNVKISNTLNSEILIRKLKPFPYQRAESELRQILTKTTVRRDKSQEIRKKSPIDRNLGILRPVFKNAEGFAGSRESRLVSVKNNPRIWEGFIESNKETNVELLPISLRYKASPKARRLERKNGKCSTFQKGTKLETNQLMFFAQETPKGQTPEVQMTLKSISKNMTDDWRKSLLYHNLKFNRGSPESFKGFYRMELEDLLSEELPDDQKSLKILLDKLFVTLEKLLIQLLGTQDDFIEFKAVFAEPSQENIRKLIKKCIDFYEFKAKTAWILENIIRREEALKEVTYENSKILIKIFSLSKKIEKGIKTWVSDHCAPFKEFIYGGQNYIIKMNKEMIYLQSLMME